MSVDGINNQPDEIGATSQGVDESQNGNGNSDVSFERELRTMDERAARRERSEEPATLEVSQLSWSALVSHTYQLDKDPNVNEAELGDFIREGLGLDISSKQLGELFSRLDRNGSGNVREPEFDDFMKKHGDEVIPLQADGGAEKPGDTRPPEGQTPPVDTDNSTAGNADGGDSGEGGSSSSSSGDADVEFFGYTTWRDGTRDFDPDGASYFVYVESHGSQGHGDINENQKGFVDVEGAELVDYGGGRDKYIALFKVTDPDNVSVNANGGAAGVLFLDTDQTVELNNARTVNPRVQNEKFEENIRGPESSNEIVIYAEDEGGKGWGDGGRTRDDYFVPNSSHVWGRGGDDMVYMFEYGDLPPDNDEGPRGNGATGTLVFK